MNTRSTPGENEEHDRTLYIRLPHTIHNMDEIRDLFAGDIQIKLPRQSSRHCHVTFSTVEEKMKNLKEVRKKMIDNKRIIACTPKIKPESCKKIEKKTVVPSPKPEKKITQILYVTNINPKTKLNVLKKAMGDCKSATFLDNTGKSIKQAIVRIADPKLSAEYLKKERPWPIVDGNQLIIKPDTRKQKKKKPGLKIWDGDVEITNDVSFDSSDGKKDKKKKKSVRVKATSNGGSENINGDNSESTVSPTDHEEE